MKSGRSAALALLTGGCLALMPAFQASGALVGEWRFDDPSDRFKAELGQPLAPSGTVSAVAGLSEDDGAVRVGVGSFLRCAHDIAANGGGTNVNEYSLVWDFAYPATSYGQWMSLLQTTLSNSNDGDLFIRGTDRALGVGAVGYTAKTTLPAVWYRVALSVKNGSWCRLYVNGELWLQGAVQALDGRFSLATNAVLFAADEDGEDYPLDFSRIAVYSHALSAAEAAGLGGPTNALGAIAFLTPPYLQNMSPTGLVVMCETAENIPLQLRYGPTAAYGTTVDTAHVSSGSGTWFHRALLTGLSPERVWHYQMLATNGTPVGGDRLFQTSATGAVDFAFGVWGDSQGQNRGTWTAAPAEPTVSMMKHMAASGVAFGLTSGDLAENGASYSDTHSYYLDRVALHLGSTVPWYVAWGNHDTATTSAVIRLASDLPSRYRAGLSPGHGSYAFSYANCFFVCLDHSYRAEITNGWLEAELGSAAAQTARFRFVAIHAPPYCERWLDGDAALRATLVPLLERYHVAVCFSGHTHEYERGNLNGVHYVISGGGSWLDFSEPIAADWPHMTVGGAQNVPGFVAKESAAGVLGAPQAISGGLFNEYVKMTVRGSTLKLECQAFNADGSSIGVLDQVDIYPQTGVTRTWDGGGSNGLWGTADNWAGDAAPADGDSLLFAGTLRQAATNSALAVAGHVTVASAGFALRGQALTLNGNLSNAVASGQTVWDIPTSLGTTSTLVTPAGGALLVAGALDNRGNLLTVDGGGNTTLAAAVSGAGALAKSGAGVLTLSSSNTYSGGTSLNGGSVTIGNGGSLGSGAFAVKLPSGGTFLTVANTSAVAVANAVALPDPAAAQTYTLVKNSAGMAAGTPMTLNGTIGGGNKNVTLFLNSNTAGDTTTTYRFNGTNTFRATVNLNRGGIVVGNPQGLGNAANLIYLNGNGNAALGDLRFAAPMTVTNPIQLVNALSPINTDIHDVALAGSVSGGNMSKLGSGALTLLGTNTYSGWTAVRGGILRLAGAGVLGGGTYSSAVENDGTLDFASSAAQTLSGVISGPGALVKSGAGKLTLTATNSYAGATAVRAGTLALGINGTLASAMVMIEAGGTLDVTEKAAFAMPGNQVFVFGAGPSEAGLPVRLAASGLDIGNAKVAFSVTGTLAEHAYVLAAYTSLTGAAFASVTGCPAGYHLDYAFKGAKQIALVRRGSTVLSIL